MSIEVLERRFAEMGARLRLRGPLFEGVPRVDVVGRTFRLDFPGGPTVGVDVVDRRWQHLVLLVRNRGEKTKFLCGRDERHWFVAAIPESAHWVSGVETAMQSLRPEAAEKALRQAWSKPRHRRRSGSFVRQGEWFFVPAPKVAPDPLHVLRNEPISRGAGSKPHVVDEVFRRGGETVYVASTGRVLSANRYDALTPQARRRDVWNVMVRDAEVYARGAVRHPDHATVVLDGWHRVVMNTEAEAPFAPRVAFLD